jgi:molybdate transport system substrate-binding protein
VKKSLSPRARRSLLAAPATAAALTLSIALAGCSGPTASVSSPTTSSSTSSTASTAALSGSITVYAAASLKTTFTTLASDFEAAHPGTTVQLTFAGSADLVTQITNGAPADVFASADEKNMSKLTDAKIVTATPVDFATNVLEIAVPPTNPASIATFADLATTGVATVVCAPEVPCGAATVAIETATGVTLKPVSEETSVTDVLGKVTSGEADAGLVYVTDVKAAGSSVVGVPFDESSQAVNTYPIAPIAASKNAALAASFSAYVSSAPGLAVLAAAGFGKP